MTQNSDDDTEWKMMLSRLHAYAVKHGNCRYPLLYNQDPTFQHVSLSYFFTG